jgi:hypothetical protein
MGDESGSTTKDIIDSVKGVVEAVPIYDDMLQPAAKELSKGFLTVAKTINVVLSPLAGVVYGYDKIRDRFFPKIEERLKNVPPENIITPKISVAGPIMEALRYTGSEEALSDLYANLLATSMDKDTATKAHPAFTEIIKQLTPDEAKIVGLFSSRVRIPLIDIKRHYINKTGYVVFFHNHSNLAEMAGCEHPDLVPTYIDNLCRLGLTDIPNGQHLTDPGIYDQLENSEFSMKSKIVIESDANYKCKFDRKGLRVTVLGYQFANACAVKKS